VLEIFKWHLSVQHLRHLLNSYQQYYNEVRTRLSTAKDVPIPCDAQGVGRVTIGMSQSEISDKNKSSDARATLRDNAARPSELRVPDGACTSWAI